MLLSSFYPYYTLHMPFGGEHFHVTRYNHIRFLLSVGTYYSSEKPSIFNGSTFFYPYHALDMTCLREHVHWLYFQCLVT